MIKNRIIYFLMIALSIGFMIATNSRQVLVVMLLMISAGLISLLCLLMGYSRDAFEISMPESGVSGKNTFIEIKYKTRGLFPCGNIRLLISCENYLYGETTSQWIQLQPGRDALFQYSLPLEHKDCGKMKVRFSNARVYDLLGIWVFHDKQVREFEFMAYPMIPELNVELHSEAAVNLSGESYDSNHSGIDHTEVFALRNYQNGDSLKSIHWKLSSKVDDLIVREYSKTTNNNIMVFCDPAFYGYSENHELVSSVYGLTAALSQSLLLNGEAHNMCSIEGADFYKKTIATRDDMMQAFQEMLCMPLYKAQDIYVQLKDKVVSSKVVVVTGFLKEEVLTELAQSVELTILLLTENGQEHVESRNNFTIVSLPLAQFKDKIHFLDL